MAHYRSVDRDIWQHPEFRGASALARHVYLYLITAAADDEGRLVADPMRILEGMFARDDDTTVQEVDKSLRELSKTKLVLLYRSSRKLYAFLTGWFEHQAEPKASFQESSLPPPPVYPACWADCRQIKQDYCAERGHAAQGISLANALTWYQQSHNAASTVSRRNVNADSTERHTEGKVIEGKVREGKELTLEAHPPAVPLQQSDSDWYRYNRVACGPLLEALREAAPTLHRSTTKCARWCRALFDAAEEPSNPWDLHDWAEALRRDPPSSSVYPDRWIEQRKREQATGPPSPRDVYADPQGTSFGPQIDRYGQRWREWIRAAETGEETARRKAEWGEAIRAAEAEDYTALEAGPEVAV